MKKTILLMFATLLVGCALNTSQPIISPQKPEQIKKNVSEVTTKHKITLLLPLTGKLADSGQAIKNGFFAAYYDSLQRGQNDLVIDVIDTNQISINEAYQKAVTKGAEFIIGPLTKEDVAKIASLNSLPVPTLALNTVDNYANLHVNNLYQFGLTARDEAGQIVDKAWQENYRRAIIIVPFGQRGESIAGNIKDTWLSMGGEVTSTIIFNPANINQQLSQNLLNYNNVNHDAVVFLATTPNQARQIQPLIKYYLNGITVFATSEIYTGISQPNSDRDLNDIIFCDMPWVLKSPSDMQEPLASVYNKINTLWPDTFKSHNKLFALGVDSYYIMLNLHDLDSSKIGINGATGILYLDNHNHVYRQLIFAKMVDGVPKIIP